MLCISQKSKRMLLPGQLQHVGVVGVVEGMSLVELGINGGGKPSFSPFGPFVDVLLGHCCVG